jgi:hypothetical protein
MSSLEDYFCLAPSPEQPILFSAKRPSASGKIVLRVGQPKDKGQEIVRVEKSGDFSSSTVAKFPGGGAPINIQKKARGHNFSMMVNGQMQSFEWRQEGGSGGGGGTLSSLLGGGSKSKSGPFILTRDGDSRPIAEFGVENSSNPLSSKRMIGFFQFVGDAARGGLGPAFSAAAIAIVLQIHNKTLEEKDTKVAMKMFSGLSG